MENVNIPLKYCNSYLANIVWNMLLFSVFDSIHVQLSKWLICTGILRRAGVSISAWSGVVIYQGSVLVMRFLADLTTQWCHVNTNSHKSQTVMSCLKLLVSVELAILPLYQHQNQCIHMDYFNTRIHNDVWRHVSRQKIQDMIQDQWQGLSLIWAISTMQWCYTGVLGMVLKLLTNPVTFWQCLPSIHSHQNLPCILINFIVLATCQLCCYFEIGLHKHHTVKFHFNDRGEEPG